MKARTSKKPSPAAAEAALTDAGLVRARWAWLLCAVTAAAWQLAFAPVDMAPLGYVALAPWAVAMATTARRRRALVMAWLTGVATFGAGLYWLSWVTPAGYLALIAYLGLYWLAAGWFLRRTLAARAPLWLSLPLIWVALEYVRAYMLSGFPWFFLAHSQYRFTPLIQIADLTGAYGVSFLVAMVNGLAAEATLTHLARRRGVDVSSASRRRLLGGVAAVAVLTAGMLIYGAARLAEADGACEPGPRIAVVQSAVPISLNVRPDDRDEDMFAGLIEQSAALDLSEVDLLVWPETVLPTQFDRHWRIARPWSLVDPDLYAEEARSYIEGMRRRHAELAAVLSVHDTPLLAGAMTVRPPTRGGDKPDIFNSALLVKAASPETLDVVDVYDKMHCVPFSEYVPFRDSAPWLHRLLRACVPTVMEQLTPGEQVKRFRFEGAEQTWTTAAPICYEGVFARVCRRLCHDDGAKAVDVLTNLSNDGWFIWPYGRKRWASSELDQHLSAYVFRAVENRTPVVRAVNTGVSGFIDSSGRIEQVVADPETGESKMVAGAAVRRVLVDDRRSVYSLTGDLAAQLICLGAAALGCVAWRRNRSSKRQGKKA